MQIPYRCGFTLRRLHFQTAVKGLGFRSRSSLKAAPHSHKLSARSTRSKHQSCTGNHSPANPHPGTPHLTPCQSRTTDSPFQATFPSKLPHPSFSSLPRCTSSLSRFAMPFLRTARYNRNCTIHKSPGTKDARL